MKNKTFFFLITLIIFTKVCYGQTDITIPDTKGDSESFIKLTDGIIKREIASFNIAGSFITKTDSFPKIKVNNIPLFMCDDSAVAFSNDGIKVYISSAWFDTLGHKLSFIDPQRRILILIDNKPFWGTDGGIPKRKIRTVKFQHEKYQLTLPDSAIEGLYEPSLCYNHPKPKETTTHCHVFQSVDKKRVYIYMLNSDGAGAYEVTWVIQNSKYFTRVVDYGF